VPPLYGPYNSMQAQAGYLPAPQVTFPGQVSAMIAAQGGIGAFGGIFPSNTYQTAVGQGPIFQGPTGIMAQMGGAAPANPYAAPNPYGGIPAYGGFRGAPSAFSPYAPNPPPAYGGLQGTGAVPFAPPPAPPSFDTAYGGALSNQQANHERAFFLGQGERGIAARMGTNAAFGAAGAAIGRRFGGPIGGFVGGMAGFLGSEMGGAGAGAQNLYGNWFGAPRAAEFGAAGAIEHMSQGFVSGGPFMHARGQGFSHHASQEAAHGLTQMAGSSSFRRDTRDRFNQQDVFRITQLASESGMMSGVSSPEAMTSRVREVARSLSSFMELAKEPDIVRAIQTMGSLRSSGLNLQETMQAVSHGKSFARMAGTSFQGLAEIGGSIGSSTFQSMGMTQGLGFGVGMGAYGQAASSINRGILSPQLGAMMGGAQGISQLNTMYSGAALQHPMTVPGLMSSSGGLNAGAMQNYLGGRGDLFSLTSQGAGALSGMANRMGVGGLGMGVALQPLLQDTVGRAIQSQGAFAGRNLEDRQVMALARQMGMRGSEGYITAAQMMGMDRTQSLSRATELGSASYWQGQRQQLGTDRAEAHAEEIRRREASAPGIGTTLLRDTGLGDATAGIGEAFHHLGVGVSRALRGRESSEQFLAPSTESARRRLDSTYRDVDSFARNYRGRGAAPDDMFDRLTTDYQISRAAGARGLMAGAGAALMNLSADQRSEGRRNLREGGEFASSVLASSSTQQRAAMGDLGSTFGGAGGLTAFSRNLDALTRGAAGGGVGGQIGGMALNGLFRGGAGMFGMGVVDPGNIAGSRAMTESDFRGAFMNSMRGSGVGQDELNRRWGEQRETIAQQAAFMRNLEVHTEAENEAWQSTGAFASRFGRRGGVLGRVREREQGAYRSLLGDVGREGQQGFQSVMDRVEGLGQAGTARYDRTRRLAGVFVQARLAAQTGGQGGRDRANELIRRATEQAAAQGLSATDIADVGHRAEGLSAEFAGNEAAQVGARGFVAHAGASGDPMAALGSQETALDQGRAVRRVGSGYASLATGGGVLQDVLRGTSADSYNEEEVRGKLAGMTRTQLDRLRREGRGGQRMADLIQRGNFQEVNAIAGRRGEQAEQLRSRYDQEESSWFRRALGTDEGARERYVQEHLQTLSGRERDLDRQSRDSEGAESAVRGAGIGGAADALSRVTTDLAEVTRNLRDVTTNGQLDRMVGT